MVKYQHKGVKAREQSEFSWVARIEKALSQRFITSGSRRRAPKSSPSMCYSIIGLPRPSHQHHVNLLSDFGSQKKALGPTLAILVSVVECTQATLRWCCSRRYRDVTKSAGQWLSVYFEKLRSSNTWTRPTFCWLREKYRSWKRTCG